MGHRTFVVDSPDKWALLAIELEQYAKELEPKVSRVIERTADLGRQEAAFAYHANTYGGNNAVSVTVGKKGSLERDVIARGSDVVFNEFGAGVTTDSAHPYATSVGVPISPGSWSSSDEGEGEFAKYGSWHHPKDVKYTGLSPSRALYNAAQKMKTQLPKFVKEVFK